MTATRLTRSGRSRFLIGLGLIILMFGFVAIFHSSQTQLDESRQQLIRCEQQQEALNARMQAIIEHKFRLERSLEAERKEHLETRQGFEQRAKEQSDQNAKAKMTSTLHYDNLNQRYKLLQKEHGDLVEDCSKSKKSHLEAVNSLDTKVKSLQSQLQQVRSLNDKDLEELKAKYDTVVQEKDRLEILLKTTSLSSENHKKKISKLTDTIMEYKNNCEYKPKTDSSDTLSDQTMPSPISGNNHHQLMPNHPLDKPLVQKSFNEQQLMIPKPLASTEDKNKPASAAENVQQMPPLNSTIKSSTVAISAANGDAEGGGTHDVNRHALSVANQPSTASTAIKAKRSSTTKELLNSPHKPPKHIPLGVAPIPENFEYLLSNNRNDDQQAGNKLANLQKQPGEADNKQDTDNNRYVNVVDELVGKNNEGGEQDTGAHEVKDADFNADKNDENVNNGAEEDNNFFEAKIAPKDNDDRGDGDDMEVFGMGGGHKQNHNKDRDDDLAPVANALLDADNLNNEVAGDQGKEQFADGLHIDEGNEEEEDEDDYSNPAARQQEGPAIRN
ncbi:MATH and LRR domain-containing protein PFE0570w isoform X3 [Eupeodes corollae]|uniref:MATH and LRR domain-containing protein PFE0570w isoform X3 n=1 Tax=Eupeodes corollae TaxID=290404 RepID=UPI00249226C5|nr:MATH and LRR domain-containing protein PFE0570w isoform X3 [Eupeodes corollae]